MDEVGDRRDWKKIDEPHLRGNEPRFREFLQDQLYDESDIREARLRENESKETMKKPNVQRLDTKIEKALKWPTQLDVLTFFVAGVVTFWAAPLLMPEQTDSTFFLVGYLSGATTSYGLMTAKEIKK